MSIISSRLLPWNNSNNLPSCPCDSSPTYVYVSHLYRRYLPGSLLVPATLHWKKKHQVSWWLNQPIWKIWVKNGFIFPNFRDENKKYLSCHHLARVKVDGTGKPCIYGFCWKPVFLPTFWGTVSRLAMSFQTWGMVFCLQGYTPVQHGKWSRTT